MIPLQKKNMTEVNFIQLLSYNIVSKQKKKNENIECHDMFIPLKRHLNSKQGSLIFLLFESWNLVRSSHPEVFCRIGSLRNFAKFTGKHFLIKRDSGTGIFIEFCEISMNSFFDRTPLVAASV